MKKVLIIIAVILIVSTGRVYAQSLTVSVNQTYLYDQTGNSATNITNSNTNITTAGITYIRSNKTKTRLRYNFNPFSSLSNGYYDIIFNTFNQDENIPVATISFGSNTFNCESISDYYTSFYSNGTVNDVEFQSGGNVLYICKNVYVTNTNYANLYFTSGVNGSSTHYFYLSSVFNFIPVENITSAINNQTDSIINANDDAVIPTAPSSAEAESIEETEVELIENNQFDSNVMNIQIDSNASNWIWNKVTSIVQANAKVFTMIITVLSIGIIKLVFNR